MNDTEENVCSSNEGFWQFPGGCSFSRGSECVSCLLPLLPHLALPLQAKCLTRPWRKWREKVAGIHLDTIFPRKTRRKSDFGGRSDVIGRMNGWIGYLGRLPHHPTHHFYTTVFSHKQSAGPTRRKRHERRKGASERKRRAKRRHVSEEHANLPEEDRSLSEQVDQLNQEIQARRSSLEESECECKKRALALYDQAPKLKEQDWQAKLSKIWIKHDYVKKCRTKPMYLRLRTLVASIDPRFVPDDWVCSGNLVEDVVDLWIATISLGESLGVSFCLESLGKLLRWYPKLYFRKNGLAATVPFLRTSDSRSQELLLSMQEVGLSCIPSLYELFESHQGRWFLRNLSKDRGTRNELLSRLVKKEALFALFSACTPLNSNQGDLRILLSLCVTHLRQEPLPIMPEAKVFRYIAQVTYEDEKRERAWMSMLHKLLVKVKDDPPTMDEALRACFETCLYSRGDDPDWKELPKKLLSFWNGEAVHRLLPMKGFRMLLEAMGEAHAPGVQEELERLLKEFEWTLEDDTIEYRFSLDPEIPYGYITPDHRIVLPYRLIKELHDHPEDPPLRFVPSYLRTSERVPYQGDHLSVVIVTPTDRARYEKQGRNNLVLVELPYEEARGAPLAKAWARILALGIRAISPPRDSPPWRMDFVVFEDDDIASYQLDRDHISVEEVTSLQMRLMDLNEPPLDLVTVSPGRNKKFSQRDSKKDSHSAITVELKGRHQVLTVREARRPEHCFLIRTRSLVNTRFVPNWFMRLSDEEWKVIDHQGAKGVHEDSNTLRYTHSGKPFSCNLWKTVFYQGEDFGLGYQELKCKRLVNVFSMDNRRNSAANTDAIRKLDYMVQLEWRSLVASRLLYQSKDEGVAKSTRKDCKVRIAPYISVAGACHCTSQKKSCNWPIHDLQKCPCRSLGYNCTERCVCEKCANNPRKDQQKKITSFFHPVNGQ